MKLLPHAVEVIMSTIRCPGCRMEVPRDTTSCPSCGYPIKAFYETSPGTRTGFLNPTKPLAVLLVAIALLFLVLSYIMFFDGRMEMGVFYAVIGLILLIWGGKAFKDLLPGSW